MKYEAKVICIADGEGVATFFADKLADVRDMEDHWRALYGGHGYAAQVNRLMPDGDLFLRRVVVYEKAL